MQVTLIPTDHITSVWPLVDQYMERAAQYTYGRYTVEDIKDSIVQYDHQLWVAFDDTRAIKGAVVTYIKQYPRKRFLDMVFVGGDDGMEWKDPMLTILRKWAADNHCDGIESSGRLGWSKIFKRDGYTPLWQSYELPLSGETEA